MTVSDDATSELIERYLAIVENDDDPQFGELFTADCTFTLMPIGRTRKGLADTNNEYLVVEYEQPSWPCS